MIEIIILFGISTMFIGIYAGWRIREEGIKAEMEDRIQLAEEAEEER